MTKQLISSPKQYAKPLSAAELTKEQVDTVAYFFVKLKIADPQQYDLLIPDEATAKITKREYAPYLIKYNREEIDIGIAALHRERIANNPDYKFLKIHDVIGLIDRGGKKEGEEGVQVGAHKYFYARDEKRLPEPEYQRQKRKEKGLQHTTRILSMFDEGDENES